MFYLFTVFDGLLTNEHLDNILLHQYLLLLLTGFEPKSVKHCDIDEASTKIKLYVQQLINFEYPIRPTTHSIIHIPKEVAKFVKEASHTAGHVSVDNERTCEQSPEAGCCNMGTATLALLADAACRPGPTMRY